MGLGIVGSLFGDSSSDQSSRSTTQSNTVSPAISAGDSTQEQVVLTAGGNNNTLVSPGGYSQSLSATGANSLITTSDFGAINRSFDLAQESLRNISATAEQASQLQASSSADSTRAAFALADQARQSETSGAINNLLQYGVWVALAGIAAYAYVHVKG